MVRKIMDKFETVIIGWIEATEKRKADAVKGEDYSEANNQDRFGAGLRQALVLYQLEKEENDH